VIIRSVGSSQLLITQPDHAALSARIMREWRAGGFPDAKRRSDILLAIAEHDNGWREVDAAPIVDEEGRIHDFVSAPDPIKWSIWPRGVDRLAATPYAAALVAQHAVHVYRHKRTEQDWAPFFVEMEGLRDKYLLATGIAMNDLLSDYAFVRIGDLTSLTFCNAWPEQQVDDVRYAIRFDGRRLTIAPDPFEGRMFAIEVNARELPKRPLRSAAEAHAAFAAAPVVPVSALTVGV
jgi:hypothetical protein